MIDHIGFAVTDVKRSRRFYDAALAPLGITVLVTIPPDQNPQRGTVLGYGKDGHPFFWIGDNERVGEGTHIAFRAESRAQVEAFHAAAVAAGGTDNGAPGLREHYGPNYYAAFVRDPDGVNVEAVTYASASSQDDGEFDRQMAVAREIMARERNALRELAKS